MGRFAFAVTVSALLGLLGSGCSSTTSAGAPITSAHQAGYERIPRLRADSEAPAMRADSMRLHEGRPHGGWENRHSDRAK